MEIDSNSKEEEETLSSNKEIYDFEIQREDIIEHISNIVEDKELELFYNSEYLKLHEECILTLFDALHNRGIDLCLGKQTISFFYTIDREKIRKWFKKVFSSAYFKNIKPCGGGGGGPACYKCSIRTMKSRRGLAKRIVEKLIDHKKYKRLMSLKKPILYITISKGNDLNNILAVYAVSATEDNYTGLEEINKSIKDYNDSIDVISKAADAFLGKEKMLTSYYNTKAKEEESVIFTGYLEKRKANLLESLRLNYCSYNILLRTSGIFEYEEIFRHFFTNEKNTAGSIFMSSLNHINIKRLVVATIKEEVDEAPRKNSRRAIDDEEDENELASYFAKKTAELQTNFFLEGNALYNGTKQQEQEKEEATKTEPYAVWSNKCNRRKHELFISIKKYTKNNEHLQSQINFAPKVFTSINRIKNEIRKLKLSDVLFISEVRNKKDELLSLSYLPPYQYDYIIGTIKALEYSMGKTERENDQLLLSSSCYFSKDEIGKDSADRINKYVAQKMLETVPQKHFGEIKTGFFSDRGCVLWDQKTGTVGSIRTMCDSIGTTFDRMKEIGDACNWAYEEAPISMNSIQYPITEFMQSKKEEWSPEIRDIMCNQQEASKVKEYQNKRLPSVDTYSLNIGNNRLTTSVLPCLVNERYYQINVISNTNNTISTNIIHNNTTTTTTYGTIKNQKILELMDEMVNEDDPVKRRALKEKALKCQSSSPPGKKRKRITIKNQEEEEEEEEEGDVMELDSNDEIKLYCTTVCEPDEFLLKRCPLCNVMRSYDSFIHDRSTKTIDGVMRKFVKERNICGPCKGKYSRVSKPLTTTTTKQRKLTH